MKRWLAKLVVFLLLGAVVNVAVAWGCAWLVHLNENGRGDEEFDRHTLLTTYEQQEVYWDPNRVVIEDGKGFGIASISIDCLVRREQAILGAHKAGWPAYSLAGETIYSGLGWERRGVLLVNHPIKHWYRRPLPLRPIWLGSAFNTIFYAALLWIVTLGPVTARRIIRRKRGHCIKCGYDLRGDFSAGCSECGWRRDDVP